MMKHEFESLAGYEVSAYDYDNIIEPMYMATNLDKEAFVKCIDKKRFALRPTKAIVKEMKKIAEQLKETCTRYTDYDLRDRLEAIAKEYIERRGLAGMAAFMVETTQHFSCYYPSSITIYSKKTYETIEEIKLF